VSDQDPLDVREATAAALRCVESALEIRQLIAEYFGSEEQVEEHANRLEGLIDGAIFARIKLKGRRSYLLSPVNLPGTAGRLKDLATRGGAAVPTDRYGNILVYLEDLFAGARSSSVEGWGGTLYRSTHAAALAMVEKALSLPVAGSGIEAPLRTWEFAGEKQVAISRAFRKHHQAIQRLVLRWPDPEGIAPAIRRGICEESEKVLAALLPEEGEATGGPAAAQRQQEATSSGEYFFRREGDYWRIRYGAEEGLAKHAGGMGHIARLLGSPQKHVPALDLVAPAKTQDKATCRMTLDETAPASDEGGEPDVFLSGPSEQEVLDNRALSQYRARLQGIEEDLAQAREDKDHGWVDRLETEKHTILEELNAAKGLGGHKRRLGPAGDSEKARQAVRNAIRRAIRNLKQMQPALPRLAEHLKKSIVGEGTSFVYRPAGTAPAWDL
jgi:hypothetical protein